MFIGMAKIGAGLLAATLTVGGGAAAARAGGIAQVPNTVRQGVCEAYQSKLAQNLGITTQQLQDARKKAANEIIDDQLAAGTITPQQAQQAHDRVNNGTGACEQVRQAAVQLGKVELKAVAQKLGISERDLVEELRGGKSLAQVAQAHNVGRDDLKATMRTAFKGEIDQRVQAGKLTQDRANKALATFDARIDRVIDRVGRRR